VFFIYFFVVVVFFFLDHYTLKAYHQTFYYTAFYEQNVLFLFISRGVDCIERRESPVKNSLKSSCLTQNVPIVNDNHIFVDDNLSAICEHNLLF